MIPNRNKLNSSKIITLVPLYPPLICLYRTFHHLMIFNVLTDLLVYSSLPHLKLKYKKEKVGPVFHGYISNV